MNFAQVDWPREGQGIVEFGDRRSLDYALDNRHDLELNGKRLQIEEERERSRSRSRRRSESDDD